MSVTATCELQAYLEAAWVDLLAANDVRAPAPIVCEYGIQGSSPLDRIASTGTLSFTLDNSTANSGSVLGYYSPMNANKRTGFDFNVPIRLKITSGATARYKFRGTLASIVPTPGLYGDQLVTCTALDWMDHAAELNLPDLDAQLSQRSDQLVTTIMAALAAADQPVAQSIETGLETYNIALDGGVTGARPKVRAVLNDICMSELGYFYVRGDATTGGVAQFENRHHRAANPTVQIALTTDEITRGGLSVPGDRSDIYSTVQVYVRPTRVDTAATTVLYSLQTASTLVNPGASITIFGPYRDPTNNDQIGGTATVDPVATTDYLMNSAADGSGTNLTANFTVVASRTGLGVSFLITNTGATAGYVTMLQLRGKGIYRYSAMAESVVAGSYGTRSLQLDMSYQNSMNVAADVAAYLAQLLSSPFSSVPSVTFLANQTQALMDAAITLEPGDRISVTETITGVADEFTINSVKLECRLDGDVWCTWGLEPTVAQDYWLIGTVGASEIGETTVVGF